MAHARVATAAAERYLTQLCKHFAHKIPVHHGAASAVAEFARGTCRMQAADGVLTLYCEAEDHAALAQVAAIVEDHLRRFGWREALTIGWSGDIQTCFS